MSLQDGRASPVRLAIIGFAISLFVGLLVGIVGYGDAAEEAIVTAVGIGLGVAIAFYVYHAVTS